MVAMLASWDRSLRLLAFLLVLVLEGVIVVMTREVSAGDAGDGVA